MPRNLKAGNQTLVDSMKAFWVARFDPETAASLVSLENWK
jgi:hypothetical protein